MKRADLININYLINHAEDIIKNTNVLFPEWLIASIEYSNDENLRFIWKRMYQKHQVESGIWYIFGRGDRWIGPNETHQEAEDRIVREYLNLLGIGIYSYGKKLKIKFFLIFFSSFSDIIPFSNKYLKASKLYSSIKSLQFVLNNSVENIQ